MKFSKALAVAVLAVSAATTAVAQTQLKVSTGSGTGNYSRMFKEFQGVCKDQIMQIEVPSSGSVQNMDRLLGNEVNAAIVQTDVLFYRARNEDLSNIKTLFALYPEEIHVLAPTVSPIKTGGVMGVGAKPIKLETVSDLQGLSVAAWGGSIVTAQVIRLQAEIQFTVTEVPGYKEAKAALDAGQVAAIVMVGGQPMQDVQALSNAYRLLSFNDAVLGKLKSVYVPAKLNYSNMGQNGSGIQTVATEALYVTRAYKTPKFVESMAALRSCFKANVAELSETTGMHKKWASVNADNQGKWAYYELPTVSVTQGKRK
jgi:TRAP-type uncharacterized transport system substrate-binding protein